MNQKTLRHLEKRLGHLERYEEESGNVYFVGCGQVLALPHPVAPRLADPLVVGSLTAFAEAVAVNVDELELRNCLIAVAPSQVKLLSALNTARQREATLQAVYVSDWDACLGLKLAPEKLFTLLATRLDKPEEGNAAKLLDGLKEYDVTDSTSRKAKGLKVEMSSTTSMTGTGMELLDPVVNLHPFRAFPEAFPAGRQVGSRFFLEVEIVDPEGLKLPRYTLLEADGGAWIPLAAKAVAEHLKGLLDKAATANGLKPSDMPTVIH
jgi:hypothetical protein